MQNGSLTSAARSKAIETDIRTIKGQKIVTRVCQPRRKAFGKTPTKQQTQRRLTSSAVMPSAMQEVFVKSDTKSAGPTPYHRCRASRGILPFRETKEPWREIAEFALGFLTPKLFERVGDSAALTLQKFVTSSSRPINAHDMLYLTGPLKH